MAKAAAILIAPMVALRALPEQDRAVVRRFLFDLIRGLDAKHDKRWRMPGVPHAQGQMEV